MYKIGFIGCGNMGSAMLRGVVSKGDVAPSDIIVAEPLQEKADAVAAEFGVNVTTDNTVAAQSELLVLAIKPQVYAVVLEGLSEALGPDTLLLSLAPGKTLAYLAEATKCTRITRLMPNTPAAVGEGMTSVVYNDACTEADKQAVMDFVTSFGRAQVIPEHLIDAATAIAGCSPAYVYMFIEAMADAAVIEGMPRAQAYQYAAQAVLGSAKMVIESGKHPAELKDAVCSPGGTTIAGLRALEKAGFRSAVIEGLEATCEKARNL
ncbi:pyrroline-5-carboxylate reductase [Slackia heliotrinireducens]|uniref:Pyrroline-5-carboxylate reductase n=1 Tax=Slackia heliotrinireducens (strain ATCC 29202 / DSM 20476 / NCTC 11029 / RHS 1) TaxID=471855 RepID=C7N6W4_SLAHD|nr:pyrroline-5-carboxylate reductase [Slackia heliotrinireducens]ACV22649.1 pyrroline-5-carboxylate reductase [Slackia heliotrinireducens DSM 20476]VEH01206.1 Pyrroline-5-carboxylate reductase [Slackia heliotrinireducens]